MYAATARLLAVLVVSGYMVTACGMSTESLPAATPVTFSSPDSIPAVETLAPTGSGTVPSSASSTAAVDQTSPTSPTGSSITSESIPATGTWENATEGLVGLTADCGNLARVAVRPDRDVLIASVATHGLWSTGEGTDSWSQLGTGRGSTPITNRATTFIFDPVSPGTFWEAGIYGGGVYRTDDGGRSWRTAHKGVRAQFLPNQHPEFGQCVHKIARHPARPDRLYLQNHWGLYRTDDAGDSWTDVANGVPSDFGFGMAVHPHDPDTAYIVPLESDGFRCTPEGRLRVYRTRDAGKSWQPMTRGLPQKDALETVLRDALTTDGFEKAGVYFGTRSGKLFASRDSGTSWTRLADGLPPIVCVKTAAVAKAKAKATGKGKAR